VDYSRLNETNLNAHYLIPTSGLWQHHAQSNTELILPKASLPQTDAIFETDKKGPRQRVENHAASLEDLPKLAEELKLEPTPSSSAKPSSATDLLPRLRWANLGHFYHWGTKSYDLSKKPPPIPCEVREFCRRLVAGVNWDDVWRNCVDTQDMEGLSSAEWNSWEESYSQLRLCHVRKGVVNTESQTRMPE
jgi:alkylated DNA repair protein alkB family protein 1